LSYCRCSIVYNFLSFTIFYQHIIKISNKFRNPFEISSGRNINIYALITKPRKVMKPIASAHPDERISPYFRTILDESGVDAFLQARCHQNSARYFCETMRNSPINGAQPILSRYCPNMLPDRNRLIPWRRRRSLQRDASRAGLHFAAAAIVNVRVVDFGRDNSRERIATCRTALIANQRVVTRFDSWDWHPSCYMKSKSSHCARHSRLTSVARQLLSETSKWIKRDASQTDARTFAKCVLLRHFSRIFSARKLSCQVGIWILCLFSVSVCM